MYIFKKLILLLVFIFSFSATLCPCGTSDNKDIINEIMLAENISDDLLIVTS